MMGLQKLFSLTTFYSSSLLHSTYAPMRVYGPSVLKNSGPRHMVFGEQLAQPADKFTKEADRVWRKAVGGEPDPLVVVFPVLSFSN
jgi:hypothetical protein